MSNHSPFPFDDEQPEFARRAQIMRDLLASTGNYRGAIDHHPEGKLTPTDEGAIQFAIGEAEGKVVIDFGTAVHWVGMTPQQAADFASTILKKARLVARKNGETVGFVIS